MSDPAAFDPLIDKAPARYVVGIDLGTTNSAVMYVDTEAPQWEVLPLSIRQLVAPNQIESLDTLPSFHFQVLPQSAQEGAVRLPWVEKDRDWCVGTMARDEGNKSPGRLIGSAKSWLWPPWSCDVQPKTDIPTINTTIHAIDSIRIIAISLIHRQICPLTPPV